MIETTERIIKEGKRVIYVDRVARMLLEYMGMGKLPLDSIARKKTREDCKHLGYLTQSLQVTKAGRDFLASYQPPERISKPKKERFVPSGNYSAPEYNYRAGSLDAYRIKSLTPFSGV